MPLRELDVKDWQLRLRIPGTWFLLTYKGHSGSEHFWTVQSMYAQACIENISHLANGKVLAVTALIVISFAS